jgi:GT2 family glycosyltransferase
MARPPLVSIVLATHNRKDVVTRTIGSVHECGLPGEQYELIVVDNASTDGTAEALTSQPDIHLFLPLRRNHGSCAKAFGIDRAGGRYVVFLDDDSYPRPGSLATMVRHFETDPRLAAAGFTVHLPNGKLEGGALPGVFVGCGVGFRAEALRAAGGLDRRFFMQAEEYDLCFRLMAAGWKVAVFDDLHATHLKTAQARISGRTMYFDTRNNLRVAARYLPAPYHRIYRDDWAQRYRWFAERDGHEAAFRAGRRAARVCAAYDRIRFARHRLTADAFEFFFRWRDIERRMGSLREQGHRRIILADLGKNIYAFCQGARRAGLSIAAIADDRFGAPDRMYRGTPVLPVAQTLGSDFDAVVVGNCGAVHAAVTRDRMAEHCDRPVFCWFAPPTPTARISSAQCAPGAEITNEADLQPACV